MATKKKKKATKKKAAAKKPAAKKKKKKAAAAAAKKPAAKKKAKAKAKPKAKAKAPKAKAAPKATKEKAAAKPTSDAGALETAGDFPPLLKELEEMVNGGRAGELDFEMYQSFNEQYKPSDWTRNPVSDTELWSFGMDGSGGQVALWQHQPNLPVESRPVMLLGSEGEVIPLASDLPSFLYLVASGAGPMEIMIAEGTVGDDAVPNDEMLEWVSGNFPTRTFPKPAKIVDEAKSKFKHFEEHLRAQCPAD